MLVYFYKVQLSSVKELSLAVVCGHKPKYLHNGLYNATTVHPSIILTTYRLNPISAVLQWKNTLSSSLVCCRANRKTGTIHTHACWVNRCEHVFGLWQEAGVPENNPCMHSESMQSAQRKTPATQEVQGGQRYPLHQGVIMVLTEKTRMWPVYQILSQSIKGVFIRSLKRNHKCQSCGSKRSQSVDLNPFRDYCAAY